MGKLNNLIKWVVMNVNFIYSLLATAIIGIAVYVMASNWGTLDPGFFQGWCIIIILFGILAIQISILGCTGVNRQLVKEGCWTGRRILALYLAILIATIIADIWVVFITMSTANGLQETRDDLLTESDDLTESEILIYNEQVEMTQIEEKISSRFNEFFFAATQGCTDAGYTFFWSWVNEHCDESLSQESCQQCTAVGLNCGVNEDSCNDDSATVGSCPYDICRWSVLNYIIKNLKPISSFLLAFTLFQALLVLFTCMLICFTERDSLQEMLVKTGTLSKDQVQRARPKQERKHSFGSDS